MGTDLRDPEARRRRRASLRIATVAGVDIRVHATFLILVAYVVATAARPGGPSIAEHLAWLVLLFAAVTVHELAHSLVARRYGSPANEIDLLPIGGMSRLGRLPDHPGQQFRIAGAGPLTSVALGAVSAAVAVADGMSLWPPDLLAAPLLVRLAWVNVILAGFNLIPAFPMDGGRMLRALLARRMDGDRATIVAAGIGRHIAIGMVVGGVVANLWIALVGAFVLAGSYAEVTSAIVQRALDDVRVRDLMVGSLPPALVGRLSAPVDADDRLLDTDLLTADYAARPVLRHGDVVGYVLDGDLTAKVEDLIARERARFGRGDAGPADRPA